jgi:hypothetical protein
VRLVECLRLADHEGRTELRWQHNKWQAQDQPPTTSVHKSSEQADDHQG